MRSCGVVSPGSLGSRCHRRRARRGAKDGKGPPAVPTAHFPAPQNHGRRGTIARRREANLVRRVLEEGVARPTEGRHVPHISAADQHILPDQRLRLAPARLVFRNQNDILSGAHRRGQAAQNVRDAAFALGRRRRGGAARAIGGRSFGCCSGGRHLFFLYFPSAAALFNCFRRRDLSGVRACAFPAPWSRSGFASLHGASRCPPSPHYISFGKTEPPAVLVNFHLFF